MEAAAKLDVGLRQNLNDQGRFFFFFLDEEGNRITLTLIIIAGVISRPTAPAAASATALIFIFTRWRQIGRKSTTHLLWTKFHFKENESIYRLKAGWLEATRALNAAAAAAVDIK